MYGEAVKNEGSKSKIEIFGYSPGKKVTKAGEYAGFLNSITGQTKAYTPETLVSSSDIRIIMDDFKARAYPSAKKEWKYGTRINIPKATK